MIADRLTPLRVVASQPVGTSPTDRAPVAIYRPFFLVGILSVLTAGCTLGAVALFGIARQGSYIASTWTPYVLAHANSQLFGWVGFFVMGFALQQHGTTIAKAASFHKLAYASLGLMGAGILVRFLAEPMAAAQRGIWIPIGVAACLLQLAAVVLFLYNSGANRYRSGKPLTWQAGFVFSSLFWLTVAAAVEPFVFALSHQASPEASIMFVAKWFVPYRELQFLGFVSMMIFGVALTKLHSCMGFKEADRSWGLAGLTLWTAGLVTRLIGWPMYFDSGFQPDKSLMLRIGALLLTLGGLSVIRAVRVFEPVDQPIRSHKFLRAAFGWLGVAAALLLVEPFVLRSLAAPFSHEYSGAIRHALTVGFISQMIMGVGLHVVARLNRLDEARLAPLWSVFWLLNLGNAARVGLEIATAYTPAAFAPMGITGFVELTGLAIWGFHIARPMLRRAWKPAAATC